MIFFNENTKRSSSNPYSGVFLVAQRIYQSIGKYNLESWQPQNTNYNFIKCHRCNMIYTFAYHIHAKLVKFDVWLTVYQMI